MALVYNENSKLVDFEGTEVSPMLRINAEQVNKLSKALIAESNVAAVTPQPNDKHTKLIRNLFESSVANTKQGKLQESLKNVTLAVEMARRTRAPYEAFAIQLQELQMMLRQKIDLQLVLGKHLDALQDLEFMLGTGVVSPDVFIRKTDCLLKLGQWLEATACCERGLALQPEDTKLKLLRRECATKLAEYNGDI
ncbi:Sec63 complex subunit SEC72 KNAG_0F03170 [Huiozyma naganishii CBS 8797]|uniref:Translocation protein SEC72 n=1 Tax=Huiozyma naganishii (strain ATCC MYA-139 / BCRC 22969 / CBS 8797 / KCTC 17520 / NBRC 10181 / NCYC 3082 / Yp74L-3) TaxID=1071383 RepID=J7S7I5_HUIN7|nr:hypothetical protein KNAG_0F03170 [Kazachstania naganishii CBS 8797]CCK70979.1 hypothetical protein KNAG_0F03170 [Kazachstania naganishii CBS 8797]